MHNAMQEAGLYCPEPLINDGKLHRFDAPNDPPKSKKGWYILYDSEPPAGAFGRWQGTCENKTTWCGKVTRTLTADEKKAYAKQMEQARQQREADLKQVQSECRAWCLKAWNEAKPANPEHPYLVRKKIKPHGLRQYKDTLIIPLSSNGTIHGIQFISPDGSKKFKTGTQKIGNCYKIGTITDSVIVCEGFATGASIHEATGKPVLIAFDAGNLKSVVEYVRTKLSDVDITVAADNDAWVKLPDGDKRAAKPAENTGVVKAKECCDNVIIPRFKNVSTYPTDFNDLHILEGINAVTLAFEPVEDIPPLEDHYSEPIDDVGIPTEDKSKYDIFDDAPFQPVGYDRSEYYYLPDGSGQIKALKASEHSKANLMTMAPLRWWEGAFGMSKTKGFDEDSAKNALIQTSHQKGIYDPDIVRGLGAWDDEGRSVLHLGDVVSVAGKRIKLSEFKKQTHFVYERALKISDEDTAPLNNADAVKLVELCDMLSWEKPINGKLLAGWCVASVICGALKWRPHLFLTGPSGTGKSWVISSIIKLIGGQFIKGMLSSTTEPGLRRAVGNNAFSVFIDEFESESPEASNRIQSILEFARPCSCNKDSKIYKAKQGGSGVDSYMPRACIGMAAIGVNIKQRADTSRVSVLSLVKGKEGFFEEKIEPFWVEHFTPEFARGIRARSILNIPMINKNVVPFQKAVTRKIGGRRDGDQYGTLLACCYSLYSNNEISLEKAQDFVDRQNWDGHIAAAEQTDERRCLAVLMEHIIRIDTGASYNIAELISMASGEVISNFSEAANATLQRYGIKYVEGGFAVSNTHTAIAKILEKTPWSANWGRMLSRLEGATKPDKGIWFSGGTSRVVMLPLRYAREM